MKFLSVLLIACIIFLSSFSGMVKMAVDVPAKRSCCAQMGSKMACQHSKGKTSDMPNGCDKPGCAMMLSCSICGFLAVEPVVIKPVFARLLPKPVLTYKIGMLYTYQPANWKPPKAC